MSEERSPLADARSVPADQRSPMSDRLSRAFIGLYFADQSEADATIEDFVAKPEIKNPPFVINLMQSRILAFAPGCLIRPSPLILCATMSDSPGKAVMWAFYLVRRSRELGRAVTIVDMSEDFPMGFPTDQGMSELWDRQKGGGTGFGGNRIDLKSEWDPPAPVAEEALPPPVVGRGVFGWPGEERRSDRYGVFALVDADYINRVRVEGPFWDSSISRLQGQRCKVTARVLESRRSSHLGDEVRDIRPVQPDVGEVIELGTGTLFVEDVGYTADGVGLKPDDHRKTDWFDPVKLYRLHDQTVEITVEPVPPLDPASVPPPAADADDGDLTATIVVAQNPEPESDGMTSFQVKTTRL